MFAYNRVHTCAYRSTMDLKSNALDHSATYALRNIEGRIFFQWIKKGNSRSRTQEFAEGNIEKDKQHHYSMPKHFELRVVEKIFHLTTKANLKPNQKIDYSLLYVEQKFHSSSNICIRQQKYILHYYVEQKLNNNGYICIRQGSNLRVQKYNGS